MITIVRTQESPTCLEQEKKKRGGNYECGDTLIRLKSDFHGKCYICEKPNITDVQIDHFLPQSVRPDLRCEWKNLFYSCFHCNNTKLDKYMPMLDCTQIDTPILYCVRYGINPVLDDVSIDALSEDIETQNTAQLLRDVYFGTTPHKQCEAVTLREMLYSELFTFDKTIQRYLSSAPMRKPRYFQRIIEHLQPQSAFAAFKIWYVWQNQHLRSVFETFIPFELRPTV